MQWVIPDDRVLSTPRTDLWRVRGEHQIYITEQHAHQVPAGSPGLTFAADTPDIDHYKGNSGGRVLPLYAGADKTTANLAPGLLDALTARLGLPVSPEDLVAYIAAITAHPAFTERFAEDLRTPGIRVPLTADPEFWARAVELGRRVLWLHSRGHRYADRAAGRPAAAPRVTDPERVPFVVTPIPGTPEGMPDEISYDPDTRVLTVGEGQIAPVAPEVWEYQISGMRAVRKWFGYRRRTRPVARGEQSPLDDIRPDAWPVEYTTDLLELLHVLTLVTELETEQAQLLDDVMAAGRITVADLSDAGVFPVPESARSPLGRRPTGPVEQAAFDI